MVLKNYSQWSKKVDKYYRRKINFKFKTEVLLINSSCKTVRGYLELEIDAIFWIHLMSRVSIIG